MTQTRLSRKLTKARVVMVLQVPDHEQSKIPGFCERKIRCQPAAPHNYEIHSFKISRLLDTLESAKNTVMSHVVARKTCASSVFRILHHVQTQLPTWIKRCNPASELLKEEMARWDLLSCCPVINRFMHSPDLKLNYNSLLKRIYHTVYH